MFLHSPIETPGYPLATVGQTSSYKMLKNSLVADSDLLEVFGPQLNGQFGPANVDDVQALISSFGRFATRSYDREFVSSVVEDAVRVTALVTPPVTSPVLDPYQVIGAVLGNKAAGHKCLGTKMRFISEFIHYVTNALSFDILLTQCIPLYVIIPKEEIRDVSKAPRDLAFPPTWFVLLTVKYEKVFFLDTLENYFQSPIKVGIPLPQCWYMIVFWLTEFCNSVFKTWYFMWDASQFDRSHPLEVTLTWHELMDLKEALSGYFALQDKTTSVVLDFILFWSCVRLVVLPTGRIVLVIAGIYSGDVSTTNKNSYFHIVRLAICWRRHFGSFRGFRHFVRVSGLCLFGDDAVCSAHTQSHYDFLMKMPEHWQATSGASLVVSCSQHISEVSFLGRRALGDSLPHSLVPVTADMPRLISSLVFKNKPSRTHITHLSKLIACRQLLCGFSYPPPTHVTSDISVANHKGRENLRLLDLIILDYLARYSSTNSEHPQWRSLAYMGTIPATELLSFLLAQSDLPLGD